MSDVVWHFEKLSLPVVQSSVNSFVRLYSDNEILGARSHFPDSDIISQMSWNSGLFQQTFTTLIFFYFFTDGFPSTFAKFFITACNIC